MSKALVHVPETPRTVFILTEEVQQTAYRVMWYIPNKPVPIYAPPMPTAVSVSPDGPAVVSNAMVVYSAPSVEDSWHLYQYVSWELLAMQVVVIIVVFVGNSCGMLFKAACNVLWCSSLTSRNMHVFFVYWAPMAVIDVVWWCVRGVLNKAAEVQYKYCLEVALRDETDACFNTTHFHCFEIHGSQTLVDVMRLDMHWDINLTIVERFPIGYGYSVMVFYNRYGLCVNPGRFDDDFHDRLFNAMEALGVR